MKRYVFEGIVIPTDVYLVALKGGIVPLEIITFGDFFPRKVIDSETPCFKPHGEFCSYKKCIWKKENKCKAPKYKVKFIIDVEELEDDDNE